jgi:hypothetical protein
MTPGNITIPVERHLIVSFAALYGTTIWRNPTVSDAEREQLLDSVETALDPPPTVIVLDMQHMPPPSGLPVVRVIVRERRR